MTPVTEDDIGHYSIPHHWNILDVKSNGLEDMALQHVLIPLDGSPLAEQAVQYVESLVSKAGKVRLLMVVVLSIIYPVVSPSPPLLAGEIKDYETLRKKRLLKSQEYLKWLWGAIVVCILLQLVSVYVPFLQTGLRTVPLTLSDWGVILGFSLLPIMIVELVRWIQRLKK